MRVILVGFVATIILGGRAKAEIIMSEPANVGPVINDAYDVQECDFSHDGLELYFSANRQGQYGKRDIYVVRRETINDPWQEPLNLGPNVNSSGSEVEPSISGDGLELYFGCWDDWNLRVCTRPSKDAPWSSPVKIGPPVGSDGPAMEVGSNDAYGPDISADGLSMYFASTRVGGRGGDDIWMTTRETLDATWGEPVNLGPNVNSSGSEVCPSISTDGLTLVFNRGLRNMMASTRKSINDDWGPAVDLGINSPWNIYGPALSPDGSTIYFDGNSGGDGYGDNDIWQVKFIPIVDFNGDLKVDKTDMHIMVDHWGTDNSLCDISPMPWGDGIVGIRDMIVLSEHMYRLAAHWKLNETDGSIAYDSFGDYDGTLNGNPFWQPTGGMKGGSLMLDGIDDYISTPFVLNPSEGSFSVFAWVNSWMPGQVIISQTGELGETWLGTDSSGKLMTGFSEVSFAALVSETVITDFQWHYVGFVYDMDTFHRLLYVDGVLVAEDENAVYGMPSDGGLHIGASKDLEAGTFFSGLIDDVRIYNQALSAEEIAALAQ